MSDTPALVRFVPGWTEDGVSEDGLPRFRETITIIKEVPPYLRVEYEATEADFEEYAEPYKLFQKEQQAKKATGGQEGYPLALWPVVSKAELQMLSARDIFTVEELAKRRIDPAMPGELRELAERAKKMTEMTKDIGQFEAIIRKKDGQIGVLNEQIGELQNTIKAQDGMINMLKQRVA
jgi:hypothetical protein